MKRSAAVAGLGFAGKEHAEALRRTNSARQLRGLRIGILESDAAAETIERARGPDFPDAGMNFFLTFSIIGH